MSNIFSPDEVTIVRKKGDEYDFEQISTRKKLAGSSISADSARKNIIARLRKDPSVILVLEDKDGHCKESYERDGFTLTVSLQDGEQPSGHLLVTYGGHTAYEKTITDKAAPADTDLHPIVFCTLNSFDMILRHIEEKYYGFVRDDCPGFVQEDLGEELDYMYEIAEVLAKNNFELERLHTVGYVEQPCLVAFENELLLVANRHFHGTPFVEMKRLFQEVKASIVEAAAKEACKDSFVEYFQHKDGSWAFRIDFDDELYEKNLVQLLEKAATELHSVVEKVEAYESIGKEVFDVTTGLRSLFIYEVIDASLELSKLVI